MATGKLTKAPKVRGSSQQHLIHSAAIKGEKSVLRKILKDPHITIDDVDRFGRTALMLSVLADQIECAEVLLKNGANVNAKDKQGRTALHWAAYKGLDHLSSLLISRGAYWNEKDQESVTALHLATRHDSVICLELILKELLVGEEDEQDVNKRTALHWSASYGNLDTISLLLKQGCNIGIPDIDGKTPLHWAAMAGDSPKAIATVQLILDTEPSVINWQDHEGRTALHLAIADGNIKTVDTLVHFQTSLEKCNISVLDNMLRTPLHWAANLGHKDMVKLLLDQGASFSSTDSNGATALHYAAQNNHIDTVRTFLSCQGMTDEPDLERRTALMWAAGRGAQSIIRVMLSYQADVNATDKTGSTAQSSRDYPPLSCRGMTDEPDSERRTALMWAAGRGAESIIRVMLSYQADVNATDMTGSTALHAAAMSGHASSIETLIEFGAEIDAVDESKHSPLFRAAEMGHADALTSLIKGGASLAVTDNEGRSPIHWAAHGGHSLACATLVKNGISPNIQDKHGRTPLQCAAHGGFINTMNILLTNGADPDLQDNEGVTALHYACSTGYLDAVRLLLDHNASINNMELNEDSFTPLDHALLNGHHNVAQLLMERDALSINSIRDLAASRIQANFRGYSVRKGFTERKELLVKHEELRRNASERKKSLVHTNNKRKEDSSTRGTRNHVMGGPDHPQKGDALGSGKYKQQSHGSRLADREKTYVIFPGSVGRNHNGGGTMMQEGENREATRNGEGSGEARERHGKDKNFTDNHMKGPMKLKDNGDDVIIYLMDSDVENGEYQMVSAPGNGSAAGAQRVNLQGDVSDPVAHKESKHSFMDREKKRGEKAIKSSGVKMVNGDGVHGIGAGGIKLTTGDIERQDPEDSSGIGSSEMDRVKSDKEIDAGGIGMSAASVRRQDIEETPGIKSFEIELDRVSGDGEIDDGGLGMPTASIWRQDLEDSSAAGGRTGLNGMDDLVKTGNGGHGNHESGIVKQQALGLTRVEKSKEEDLDHKRSNRPEEGIESVGEHKRKTSSRKGHRERATAVSQVHEQKYLPQSLEKKDALGSKDKRKDSGRKGKRRQDSAEAGRRKEKVEMTKEGKESSKMMAVEQKQDDQVAEDQLVKAKTDDIEKPLLTPGGKVEEGKYEDGHQSAKSKLTTPGKSVKGENNEVVQETVEAKHREWDSTKYGTAGVRLDSKTKQIYPDWLGNDKTRKIESENGEDESDAKLSKEITDLSSERGSSRVTKNSRTEIRGMLLHREVVKEGVLLSKASSASSESRKTRQRSLVKQNSKGERGERNKKYGGTGEEKLRSAYLGSSGGNLKSGLPSKKRGTTKKSLDGGEGGLPKISSDEDGIARRRASEVVTKGKVAGKQKSHPTLHHQSVFDWRGVENNSAAAKTTNRQGLKGTKVIAERPPRVSSISKRVPTST